MKTILLYYQVFARSRSDGINLQRLDSHFIGNLGGEWR
jgi:hypothetical protein